MTFEGQIMQFTRGAIHPADRNRAAPKHFAVWAEDHDAQALAIVVGHPEEWQDAEELRRASALPLLLKGWFHRKDLIHAKDIGADAALLLAHTNIGLVRHAPLPVVVEAHTIEDWYRIERLRPDYSAQPVVNARDLATGEVDPERHLTLRRAVHALHSGHARWDSRCPIAASGLDFDVIPEGYKAAICGTAVTSLWWERTGNH